MENFFFYSNESSPIEDFESINCNYFNDSFLKEDNDSINDNNQHHKNKQIMNTMLIPRKKPIYRPHCKWTKEEDEKLKELIKEYGENDWRHLAKKFEGRNSRQCRERWNYYLNPRLKQGQWSIEEDQQILKKYDELGPRWMEISKYFESRTDAMIKNRYNYLIRNEKKLREKNEFPLFESHNQNSKNEVIKIVDSPMLKDEQDLVMNISFENCFYMNDSNENENENSFAENDVDPFFF